MTVALLSTSFLFRPTQRLHLLDEIGQVQRLEALRPQQVGLDLGPDVEVLVIEFGRRARVRGHLGS
jgi:hypothetical protein